MMLRRLSATLAVLASASVVGGCGSGLASRDAPRASSSGDARTGRVVVTANLWPQPNFGQATAAVKDRLENYLHDKLCAGRIGLRQAQLEIAHDWYGSWVQASRP
jgi:hypothetical protein